MNKFFGKRPQKAIIACLVVFAAAGQVFRLEAVQDFILSDVAYMLIGRQPVQLENYRRFLRGLAIFIPAASFIVFGFLYVLTTSARAQGYFRGAGFELKGFFYNKSVFSKRNGLIFLACFAITFLGYFALIRSGVGYRDDLYRQETGTFGWLARYGRVLTELINLALHGAYMIHDRSPLGQLIAMAFLSLAAIAMAHVFTRLSGERDASKLRWPAAAAGLVLAFNPYFLSGIAFKYDCPGMAASVLFPLLPFLFMEKKRLYAVSSFLCVFGVYMTYQASSGIYIMMVIFAALIKFSAEEWSFRETAVFCTKSATAFIIASALFMGFSFFFGAANTTSTTMAIGPNIARNIARYFSDIRRDFASLWQFLSALLVLAAAISFCRLSKKKLRVALPLFAIGLALALIFSQGGYIFLDEYYGPARGKYGFGAFLAILASVSCMGFSSKRILAIPALLLCWSFFTYASAFGNAHANQMKMEMQYEALIMQDINSLFPREQRDDLTIAFIGEMPWSGEVRGLARAYPITEALEQRRYKPPYFMAGRTMEYFDPSLSTEDGPAKEPLSLILSRRYYNIYIEEGSGRIVVECKIGE